MFTITAIIASLFAYLKFRKPVTSPIDTVPQLPLQPTPLGPTEAPIPNYDPRVNEVKRIAKKYRLNEDRVMTAWNLARQVSAQYGVDVPLLMAIWHQESKFNPAAINPRDPSYGLGQIQEFWVDGRLGGVRGTKANLLEASFNAKATAEVLLYFMGQNARMKPYRSFQFPSEADIYNVGEPKYRDGVRNGAYRAAVQQFYSEWLTTK